jgi:enhancing lycopene biosynthesis protein 2
MKRIAGVLAGCGVYDGAEIQEAVIALLAFARRGVAVDWFAPDIEQRHVVDHLGGEVAAGETRSVLRESARIVRGAVRPLSELEIGTWDGLLLPGGFGVAKQLCSFAFEGAQMSVLPELERIVIEAHRQHKALGFICIAPVIAAKVLGAAGRYPMVTIGDDGATIQAIQSWGASHEIQPADGICVDPGNKLVTTPAWNRAENILQVERGIERLAERLVPML